MSLSETEEIAHLSLSSFQLKGKGLFQGKVEAFYITFTFSHLADAFVQSDVQGREQSSQEQ